MFESKLGRLQLSRPDFGIEGIANSNFSQKSFFVHSAIDFGRLLDALGAVFRIFAALATSLIIHRFSVVQRSLSRAGGVAK